MKKGFAILLLGGVFVLGGWLSGENARPGDAVAGKGQGMMESVASPLLAQNKIFAPDFTLLDLEGRQVSSKSLRGKVVLLHFWATWCHYCRREIPHLNEIYAEYAGRGVAILAVSLDRGGAAAVRAFKKRVRIDYPVAMGNRNVQANFGNIRGLPTTFVISPEWQITHVHQGYVPKLVLENSIKELLKKQG